jgi:hypothetical protein
MTYSVLGPGGYPRPPYASFAGKPVQIVTKQVGEIGVPGAWGTDPFELGAGRLEWPEYDKWD